MGRFKCLLLPELSVFSSLLYRSNAFPLPFNRVGSKSLQTLRGWCLFTRNFFCIVCLVAAFGATLSSKHSWPLKSNFSCLHRHKPVMFYTYACKRRFLETAGEGQNWLQPAVTPNNLDPCWRKLSALLTGSVLLGQNVHELKKVSEAAQIFCLQVWWAAETSGLLSEDKWSQTNRATWSVQVWLACVCLCVKSE